MHSLLESCVEYILMSLLVTSYINRDVHCYVCSSFLRQKEIPFNVTKSLCSGTLARNMLPLKRTASYDLVV